MSPSPSLNSPVLKDNDAVMQQLADACLVVDALDSHARDELIRSICSRELTAYQQIFQGTGAGQNTRRDSQLATALGRSSLGLTLLFCTLQSVV